MFSKVAWKVAPIVAWMVAHKSRDTSTDAWVTQILAWDAFKPSQLISIRGWAVIKLAQAAWKLSQVTLKAAWDALFFNSVDDIDDFIKYVNRTVYDTDMLVQFNGCKRVQIINLI